MTHTYATLEVSHTTFDEIKRRLEAAEHISIGSGETELDMHGIALVRSIVKMNLLPYGSYPECPKCGGRTGDAEVRYSTNYEVPGMSGQFVGAGTHGDEPHPHLIKHCPHCKFGWLEKTMDAS